MAAIDILPPEIILIILQNKNISSRDIVNFSSTCNIFQCMSRDKILWKKKFAQRWPTAVEFCKKVMGIEFDDIKFKYLKKGMKCVEKLWFYVSRMSEIYYYCKEDEWIIERYIEKFVSRHSRKYNLSSYIFHDELTRNIYHQDPRQSNLTERYHSIQIFEWLNKNIYYSKWRTLSYEPNQRWEKLIVVILRRHHPDKFITILHIDKFIDNIVQDVLKYLKDKYLQHPILSIQPEQFAIWKNNYIDKNYWSETHANSIKYVLDKIIVSFNSYELWMEPNEKRRKTFFRPLYTGCILFYKHVIWLIIYICVANRLGLFVTTTRHNSVDFYSIVLVWQSRNCTKNREYFTFEWTDDRKISKIKNCRLVPPPPLTDEYCWDSLLMEICEYMKEYEELDSTEKDNFIFPPRDECDVVSKCFLSNETFHKTRSPNIKFAIGMIVTHKHGMLNDTYKDIAGVIIGWHNRYHIETFQNEDCRLPFKIKTEFIEKYDIEGWESQPYYVLLIDGDVCYVPQCVITSICEKWIDNREIGRYFCKFEGTHYVPNEVLRKYYPDDAAVVRELLSSRK